ncbi:kinase [Pseudoalteromonas sp. PS5]|uniref:kinase n=1 Tax=Pseudoalteromonas sp. PS5 TaxID=1437473 RepID=UPI000FFEA321|nr:kinase [Pseudoalteromonas sp. PS5]RXF02381.1 kinase [Pseudoalteromonas sp. PS5]
MELAEELVKFGIFNSTKPLLIGVSGIQGSGKSTLSQALCKQLIGSAIVSEHVSLDDFYLDPEERAILASQRHSLFQQRGLPGTHDVALLQEVISQFKQGRAITLPIFDKSIDRKIPKSQWRTVAAGLQVLIIEGWCIGQVPQQHNQLVLPVNRFERQYDADGAFRLQVNEILHQQYQPIFSQIDTLIYLNGLSFDRVYRWRLQQEYMLKAMTGKGMGDDEVERFIQPFQRLSEWGILSLPNTADIEVKLGENREVLEIKTKLGN